MSLGNSGSRDRDMAKNRKVVECQFSNPFPSLSEAIFYEENGTEGSLGWRMLNTVKNGEEIHGGIQ